MNPKIVWAAALVVAFTVLLGVIFKAASAPPTSYTVTRQYVCQTTHARP